MLAAVERNGTGMGTDRAGRVGQHVLGERDIRFRDQFGEAAVDHRPGARASFLGGLEEGHEGPVPGRSVRGEQAGGADQAGNVHVMATRVRNRNNLSRSCRSARPCWHTDRPVSSFIGSPSMSARIRTVGPSPFLRIPTTPVVPMLVDDLVPGLPQCAGSRGRRLRLLMPELRMAMKRAIEVVLPTGDLIKA